MQDERLGALAAEVQRFSAFLKAIRKTDDLDSIFDEYAYMRRTLTHGIAAIVEQNMPDAQAKIDSAVDRVEEELSRRYPERDVKSLKVRRYNIQHAIILEYLSLHVGEAVTGERLRFVAGDRVHTERRLRELRELGFRIPAVRVSGADSYRLESIEQDYEQATKAQMSLISKRMDYCVPAKSRSDRALRIKESD